MTDTTPLTPVRITVELSDREAHEYAQFLKRVGHSSPALVAGFLFLPAALQVVMRSITLPP